MKILKNLKKLNYCVVILVLFVSCKKDDDNIVNIPNPGTLNILQTIQSVNDLSLFDEAITQVNLIETINSEENKTILAPTNNAFITFLDNNNYNSLSEIPNDILTQILLNHVIDGTNYSISDLTGNKGYENTLAKGPNDENLSIYYDGSFEVFFNGTAKIITPNVLAKNGIIHTVNAVINLPTINTFTTSNTDLSHFNNIITYLVDNPSGPFYYNDLSNADKGPFTVFAPNNNAITSLLTYYDVSSVSEFILGPFAVYFGAHIVNRYPYENNNLQSDDLVNGPLRTVSGTDLIVNTEDMITLKDADDATINITNTDIQAINGVIHITDTYILSERLSK